MRYCDSPSGFDPKAPVDCRGYVFIRAADKGGDEFFSLEAITVHLALFECVSGRERQAYFPPFLIGQISELGRVLINRDVRQFAVDVRIAPESGRIRDGRSTSQKCHKPTSVIYSDHLVSCDTRFSEMLFHVSTAPGWQ
jgi:hypothetical protein